MSEIDYSKPPVPPRTGMFTPRTRSGERLAIPLDSITMLSGRLFWRGRGVKAVIEVDGVRYKIRGASCGLPNCMCDSIIEAVK